MLKNPAAFLFFSVSIFLPALLLGVYLAFPLIAEALLKNTFDKHDIELIELQVPRPSFNELTTRNIQLESLAFRLKDKTEVAIRGVRFSLENDDFYSANISSVTVLRTAVEDTESVEELDLLTLLPASLMRDLPMARLFVQSQTLDAPAIKLDNLIVDISKAKITAKAQLNSLSQVAVDPLLASFLKSNISLDISPDNKIDLQVSDANSAPLLGIGLSLSTKEDRLYGTLNVNHSLADVEWPMSNDEMLVVKKSQLNASAEFSLPAKQRVTPNDLSQLLLHGQLQQKARVTVGKQLGDTQLSSNASLDASLDKGLWRLSLSQDKAPFVLAKGSLASAFYPPGDKKSSVTDTLIATFNTPLVINGSLSADTVISIDAGDLALSYLEDNKRLIDMRLSDVDVAAPGSGGEQKNSLTLYSKIDIDKLGERVELSGFSLDSMKGVLNSRVSVQANRLRLDPLPKSRIQLSHFRFNDYYAKQLTVGVPQQGIDVDLNSFEFSNIALGLDGKGLVLSDANIKKWALQSKVSFKANHLVLDSTTEAMNAEVSGANHYVPPLVVKTNIQLDKASVKKASIKLANICNDPLLNVNWRTVKKKAEVLELQWKRTFSHTKTLRQWLNTSVIPVDFTQGTFSGRVIVDINENKTNIRTIDVSLKDIQGVNAMGTFEGVQLRLSSPLRRSTQHGAIKFDTLLASLNGEVDELNMGVKLNDVAFNSVIYDRHSDWQLKLPLMTAKLFSGAMEIRDEDINFNKEIQINVLLKQVDLSELIATQQVEGLQTTGKMSGSIPIRYANGQVQVLDGTMRSVEKGKIRYSTALSESGDLNEQLKLTLDVLENFDYSSLNSKIVYDADTLLLESSIVGKNPDIKNGQTINLNLNTEVGLKGAVEVMRIQSGIDSRIEKFMASKAAPNTKQYFCQ